MHPRYLKAPLLLILWQAAPISTRQDLHGRTRVSFGYGRGVYEKIETGCATDQAAARAVPHEFQAAGVRLEHWTSETLRISAFATQFSETEQSSPDVTRQGTFYGGQVSWELHNLGFGLGAAKRPAFLSGGAVPMFHFRVAPLDGFHFRVDLQGSDELFGSLGLLRTGLGYNSGLRRGIFGFGGVSMCQYWCFSDAKNSLFLFNPQTYWSFGLFFEGGLPLSSRVDLVLHGVVGPGLRDSGNPGEASAHWSAGLGARFNIGRPPGRSESK